MKASEMWNTYIKINPAAKEYEAWCFGGNTPDMPNILGQLVLEGIKTATASAYPCYIVENQPLPSIGAYNLILNTNGEAICITHTTRVYTVPFGKVSDEHAYKEGEFDRTIKSWRESHKKFFTRELNEIGQIFSEDMLVVCEEFEVVYPTK